MFATLLTIALIAVASICSSCSSSALSSATWSVKSSSRCLSTVASGRLYSSSVSLRQRHPDGRTSHDAWTKLTVGLGYIPSVQFAQFYRAQQQGYYTRRRPRRHLPEQDRPRPDHARRPGRDRHRHRRRHERHPGRRPGHSDQVRGHDLRPVPERGHRRGARPDQTAADLKGHTLGIPGRYGSSWIMLQAMLASAGLTPDDIDDHATIRTSARASPCSRARSSRRPASATTSPCSLPRMASLRRQLTVDQIVPLPGPGLIVGTSTLSAKHDALKAFVAATLRAMDEIVANPQVGVDDSDRRRARPRQQTSPRSWRSFRPRSRCGRVRTLRRNGTGAIDNDAWTKSLNFMRGLPGANIPSNLTVDQLVTEELLK